MVWMRITTYITSYLYLSLKAHTRFMFYMIFVCNVVECNAGFFRPDDVIPEKCVSCEKGTYGKKCAFTCTCQSNER